MTEWNAAEYVRRSGLQEAMAEEVLGSLDLKGAERILDVGCGDGRVTACIAERVPNGTVIGVDASRDMIGFASSRFDAANHPNLRFEAADARKLPFQEEFDLVVSFNALHWIPDQYLALRSIRSAMKPDGSARLRLVPKGERKSLEDVLEETRSSPRWMGYFRDFRDPYLHLTPEQYAALAEENGLRVRQMTTKSNAWDFRSREAFFAFGSVTFVEWTRRLPESERPAFITDVLDRYRPIATDQPGQENVFKFYQMDIRLARNGAAS
jgi:trans-aconitate 2-methyltransferase